MDRRPVDQGQDQRLTIAVDQTGLEVLFEIMMFHGIAGMKKNRGFIGGMVRGDRSCWCASSGVDERPEKQHNSEGSQDLLSEAFESR